MNHTEFLTPPAPIRSDYPDVESFLAAWLDWKRTFIGSSEAGIVLRVAPASYGSILKVQWNKLGLAPIEKPTIPMRRGHALEPLILQLWEERHEEKLVGHQVLVRHELYPFIGASIDSVRANRRIVEAKSINGEAAHRYRLGPDGDTASLMPWWTAQGQHQMACYDTDLVTFAVLVDDDFRCYDLERDDAVIERMIAIYAEFWDRHVIRQEPLTEFCPEDAVLIGRRFSVASGEVVLSDDMHVLNSAISYSLLTETIAELDKQARETRNERDTHKARLLAAMENASEMILPGGHEVFRDIKHRKGYEAKPSSWIQVEVETAPSFQRRIVA